MSEKQRQAKMLPSRAEMDPNYKWRLEDIYPSDAAWEDAVKDIKHKLTDFQSFAGRLGQSPETLAAALTLSDEIEHVIHLVVGYARMRRDEDNANATYQALTDRAMTLATEASTAMSFMTPEILSIPQETLRSFRDTEVLKLYRHVIDDLLRRNPHFLSEPQERILAEAGDVTQAPSTIFTMLDNADLKFPIIENDKGEEVELTKGRYGQLVRSSNRPVRERAFKGLFSGYQKHRNTLTATLASSIKKDNFLARVRRYDSALDASLHVNDIPVDVYDNLLTTVSDHLDVLHRYVDLRRDKLGLDEVYLYDLYAPLVSDVDLEYTYEEALATVEKALAPMGDEYLSTLNDAFSASWIDVYENQGKTSGAFSWGPYGTHPFVLLNFQGTINDVFTLAHEMGHAMHSHYANSSQPFVYANYTLFVAEVASTVNENLLTHYLLQQVHDERVRAYILNHYLDEFRAVVYRQTQFAEFEKTVHERAAEGEPLTPDGLSSIYHDLNIKYYGPAFVSDRDADLEWARIPHFYRAYYVYQYATGMSAATALARAIMQEGKPAVDRYLEFLKSGGSDYPLNLLKTAGVDLTTPKPITAAIEEFENRLNEFGEVQSTL